MKRKNSPGTLMSMADELSASSHVYGGEFQMIEGIEEAEEACHVSEKKRRLSVDQVKALEKNFEVENKLEPDRKVKLAQELGLQPRQVAVWFQNRRARWKTKQLERDYDVLKANFESLRANYDAVQQLNEAFRLEISELKAKLNEDSPGVVVSLKDDAAVTLSETKSHVDTIVLAPARAMVQSDVKDGTSDSDSSAILNDEAQHKCPMNQCHVSTFSSSFQAHLVKLEESYTCEEACNLFSDDQPPTLPWYSTDQWSL